MPKLPKKPADLVYPTKKNERSVSFFDTLFGICSEFVRNLFGIGSQCGGGRLLRLAFEGQALCTDRMVKGQLDGHKLQVLRTLAAVFSITDDGPQRRR